MSSIYNGGGGGALLIALRDLDMFEPELDLNAEWNGALNANVSYLTNDRRTLSYLFLLMLLPYISQSLMLKIMIARKEKMGNPKFLFLSSLSLLISKPNIEF